MLEDLNLKKILILCNEIQQNSSLCELILLLCLKCLMLFVYRFISYQHIQAVQWLMFGKDDSRGHWFMDISLTGGMRRIFVFFVFLFTTKKPLILESLLYNTLLWNMLHLEVCMIMVLSVNNSLIDCLTVRSTHALYSYMRKWQIKYLNLHLACRLGPTRPPRS